MRRLLPRSLLGRMMVLLVLALLCAQAVAFAAYLFDRRGMVAEFTDELVLSRVPAAAEVLRDLPPERQERVVRLLSSRWIRYVVAEQPLLPAAASAHPLAARLAAALAVEPRVAERPREASRYLGADGGRDDATRVLQIAVPLDAGRWLNVEWPLESSLWELAERMSLPLLLSVAAVLLSAAFLARRITRPLAALSDAAERFGRGEQVGELEPAGPEDVARTIRAFNQMSSRLQRFVQDRTRMLAAVSHDLRTPITALRIRAEMIDDDELRGRMIGSLEEMERMVEGALQFARAEAVSEPTGPLELRQLVESALYEVEPAAAHWTLLPGPELPLQGRPVALGRALRNLVENALRYGARAEVSLRREGDSALVVIEDSGPGIPEADQERVFEPYVRLEGSRSAETGGTGLGLAIARGIVRGHGGEVALSNRSAGGLRVVVSLPLAAGF